MSAKRGQKPWSPVDVNESNSEAVTILRYWDVTTPPPKNAKLGAFRRSKRYRRISLEMHRIPREVDQNSLGLADIFPDNASVASSNYAAYDKAFFRISKYVPIKGKMQEDDASVISNVSARTKDMYSKPDHEWRTKFLLQVSRVAITEIKNEKEVFFEAWDNGEVIARSLVFKQISQAKEFSYDLERLANEDPELNQSRSPTPINNGPPLVIEPKFPRPGKNQYNKQDQPPTTPPRGPRPPPDLVRENTQPAHNLSNRSKRGCCEKCCHNFIYILASIFHYTGILVALALFLYSIAIYSIRPNPQSVVASALLFWSLVIALTHVTGIMGTGRAFCGAICFIRISIGLAVVNIILNLSILVIFTVREDDLFDYLRDHFDKLFLTEDEIDDLNSHVLWVYILMMVGSFAEILRMCVLQKLKGDIIRRRNEERLGSSLRAPLLTDEEFQGSRRRLNTS